MDSSNAGGAAFSFLFIACYGVFLLLALALFVVNIWMLIDSIQRQEYEYPNSTGSSKSLWVIILAVGLVIGYGGIAGIVYYFMVFKKIKRGTMAPPQAPAQYTQPAPQGYVPPAPPAYAPPPAPPVYAPPAYEPPPAPPAYQPPAPPAYQPPPAPPAPPVEMPAPPAEMPAPPAEPSAE
jgi:hypothetical protein